MTTPAEQLVAIARSLFERGLTPGTTGNLSVRTENGLLITPTGSCMGRLSPNDLAAVPMSGAPNHGPVASKELPLHLAAYRRTGARAVVHLHSPYATAVSCLAGLDPDDALGRLTGYHAIKVGRLALVPYATPGSPELTASVESTLNSGIHSLLLANHGSLMMGADIESAADAAEQVEQSAQLYLLVGGREISPLTSGSSR